MSDTQQKIADIRQLIAARRMLDPPVPSLTQNETRGKVVLLPLGKKREEPVFLQDLPKGIRNRIYELVLEDEGVIEVRVKHDPDGSLRACTGKPSFASRMALAQAIQEIRAEFRQLCMKTISPVVSFFEYTQFLHHFLFTGIPFSVIRICMPLGKWPSEEVDLRPLIVARTVDTNDDPMNSIIELQGGYLERLFSDSAVWKKVLSSGQIRAISFRSERWKAYLTFTISNHLRDEWHQYGHGAVAHECP